MAGGATVGALATGPTVTIMAEVPPSPKERLAELYAQADRADLAQAAQAFLDGNLKIRARKHTRRFWFVFAVAVLVLVAVGISVVMGLLERTRESAARFENGRTERLERLAPE
jgi:hypothetical protein